VTSAQQEQVLRFKETAMTEFIKLNFVSPDNARGSSVLLDFASMFLFASLVLCGLTAPAEAQLYAGTVTGVVSDQSGAMMTQAEVTLVDTEKGFTFTAKSDDKGRYLFRAVPPGVYNMSVKATGFKDQARSGIKVDVSQNVGVDVTMPILGKIVTMTVSTAAPLLGTEDATTGQVVDRKLINDLPLLDRGVFGLAFLAPGVTEVDAACMGCSANNFVSNGSRNATADILMDGVTTTNYEQNSGIRVDTYQPSVDAVEEFKVQESNFSSEYGFSGATIINLVTRSGTNDFHGSAYEFLRHYKMDANNWFNNQQAYPSPGSDTTISGVRSAGRSSRARLSSSSTTKAGATRIRRGRLFMACRAMPSAAATLAKSVVTTAERLTIRESAPARPVNSGIRMPDTMTRRSAAPGVLHKGLSRATNSQLTPARWTRIILPIKFSPTILAAHRTASPVVPET
jgi:Carboxypeptidase regulatory-like domain